MGAGLGRLYRWWTVLRGAKRDGIEHFTADEAQAVFAAYGWSRRQYYDFLNHPQRALFASVGTDGRIYLNSLENVCMALSCRPGLPVYVNAADLRKQNTFQAVVYASAFKRVRTVSRDALQDEYGIGRNTQRRYEAHTGMQRTSNFVRASVADFEVMPIPEDAHFWEMTDDGQRFIVWQAPNAYANRNIVRACPGLAKHINRRFKRSGLFHDEVERQRFLVDDLCKERARGVVAYRTGLTFDVVRSSGRVDEGYLYQLARIEVRH